MVKTADLTGYRFGRLTVIQREDDYCKGKIKKAMWKCLCDCGNEAIVRGESLKSGYTKSCGCYREERIIEGKRRKNRVGKNVFVVEDDVVHVTLRDSKKEMICDLEDWGKLKKFTWNESIKGYAIAKKKIKGKAHIIFFHRMAIGAKEGEIVDHINRNKLDNRRNNLRITSLSMNCFNRKTKNESGYAGVLKTYNDKWRAQITVNYKPIYLGTFEELDDAIEARKKAEIKYRGELSKK